MIAIFFVLLAIGCLWAMYWALVRPFILARIEAGFDLLRSQIEWAILDGLPPDEVRPANALAEHLESADAALSLSASVIVFALLRCRSKGPSEQRKEREEYAKRPAWVREAHRTDMVLTTGAALANSPLWWPLIATILLVGYFSAKAAQWWDDFQHTAMIMRDGHFGELAHGN